MTALGKVLTVLNLVVAVGMATWAVGVYTQRPGWFDDATPSASSKAGGQVSFKQLSAEIDDLAKQSAAASRAWGSAVEDLKAREKAHRSRQPLYKQRLDWARIGRVPPNAPKGKGPRPGFFVEVRLPNTGTPDQPRGLTDLTRFEMTDDKPPVPVTIPGPDNEPLQGADTLLETFHDEVVRIAGEPDKDVPGLIAEIKDLRGQQAKLQQQVVDVETRLNKQLRIREELQTERIFLEDFRITVGGQRDTVYERRRQLEERLREVRARKPEKN